MQRTMSYILKRSKSKRDFDLLMDMCHKSKNLYNYTNYIVRQAFTEHPENIPEFEDILTNKRFVSEFGLSGKLSRSKQTDYTALKAQCSQQVIKQVFKEWKGFFKAVKSYKADKSKFEAAPRIPKYKSKNGFNVLTFPNQSCSFDKRSRTLKLAKDFVLDFVVMPDYIRDFDQVRIVPRSGYIRVEVVYEKEETEEIKEAKEKNTKKYSAGIDLGVGNLAAVTSDRAGVSPLIVNGGCMKSVNQFYNMELAKLKSTYSRHGVKSGRKSRLLGLKRKCKIDDYFHKMSRHLVGWCVEHDIGRVFVGHNEGWKTECNMGKVSNQNFVQIPFNDFIRLLKYKLEEAGIELVEVQESHTSKCSALDGEAIQHHDKYVGTRAKRGLFKTASRRRINADVNGSLNILRRGLGHDFAIGREVFNPIRVKEVRDAAASLRPADRGRVVRPACACTREGISC